jgi:hypothetical protein
MAPEVIDLEADDSATIKQRTFSSGSKDSAAADDDRGATAPPNPSSAAA